MHDPPVTAYTFSYRNNKIRYAVANGTTSNNYLGSVSYYRVSVEEGG